MLRKFLERIGLRSHSNPCDPEYLRSRGVSVGENVNIYNSHIDYCHGFLITIGNDVTITNAAILAHDASTKIPLGYSKVGCVEIGNEVFIGYGSIILPGTRIGNRVVIGAGAVVCGRVPDNSVIVGNPARILCSYDEFVMKNQTRMANSPVYNVLWSKKTEDERNRMKSELKNRDYGFDL